MTPPTSLIAATMSDTVFRRSKIKEVETKAPSAEMEPDDGTMGEVDPVKAPTLSITGVESSQRIVSDPAGELTPVLSVRVEGSGAKGVRAPFANTKSEAKIKATLRQFISSSYSVL